MSRRVRIGTCANPPDAALVRSVFAARDLHVVIGAEHHASLLGPLGASFLSLDIWVDEEDAEEAAALLRDLREHPADAALDDAFDGDADPGNAGDDNQAGTEEHGGVSEDGSAVPDDEAAPGDSIRMQLDRRRRTAIALLLGCFITFGTAHMSTRAWLRGLALAGLEGLGFRYLAAGDRLGSALVIAAVICDVAGALWRVRTVPSSTLPVARIRRS